MGDVEHPGLLVRALRERFGLSQERLAERAQLSRVEVVRAESGHNKMTSHRMRTGLARAFGLSIEQLDSFLGGGLGVDAASEIGAITARTGTEG